MVKGPDKAPEATRIKFVDAALDGLDLRAEHRVVGGGYPIGPEPAPSPGTPAGFA